MKAQTTGIWILIAFFVTSAGLRSDGDAQSVALFNGQDLSGWTVLPGGNWEVVDGVNTLFPGS